MIFNILLGLSCSQLRWDCQGPRGEGCSLQYRTSDADKEANYLFVGPCEETLPRVLGLSTVR